MSNLQSQRGCTSEQRVRYRSSRKSSAYCLVPSSQLFESASRGFSAFQSAEADEPSRLRSFVRDVNSMTEPSTTEFEEVQDCLRQNRSNLNNLRLKISRRRRREYEDYIANGLKYNKLLELNNNRSKVLTSLNNKKVGEVKVTQITTQTSETKYSVACELVAVQGWKPECREGQVCLVSGDQIVLLGGHNNYPISRLSFFNLQSSEWNKGAESDLKRTYHSAALYRQHYLIMFGGMGVYNSHYKTRECLNSCVLFTTTSNSLRSIKISNEQTVEARRQHSACIIGKCMVVYGGINTKKQYLSDLKVLDLKALEWQQKEYRVDDLDLCEFLTSGLAKHAVFTYFKQRDSYPLYSKTYEASEGMYLFGGNNQVGSQNGLLQFRFDKRTPSVHRVHPIGKAPSPVYPLVHLHKANLLLILSGERSERKLALYRIDSNEYLSVQGCPSLPSIGGVCSSLINYEDSYYVLFGLTQRGYMNNIIRFRLNEHHFQRDHRKPQHIISMQATFFDNESDTTNSAPVE